VTQLKTPFIAAAVLQYDMAAATDPQKILLPGVDSVLYDVTAVVETHLLCSNLPQLSAHMSQYCIVINK
jgi:hypothetical protein